MGDSPLRCEEEGRQVCRRTEQEVVLEGKAMGGGGGLNAPKTGIQAPAGKMRKKSSAGGQVVSKQEPALSTRTQWELAMSHSSVFSREERGKNSLESTGGVL